MIKALRNAKYYYLLCLTFILIGWQFLLIIDRGDATVFFNSGNFILADNVLKYLTWLGEWVGAFLVLILLLKAGKRAVVVFAVASLLSFGISQLLKHTVFNDVGRPAMSMDDIREVDGVPLHKSHSFPSGHTTSAFCVFTLLALYRSSKWWQFLSAFLAVSVGISRMYLGQHYLIDVVAGACLGMVVATFTYVWLNDRFGLQQEQTL